MTEPREAPDEQWIARLLTGEADWHDDDVQRALRADPVRAAEVHELLGLRHDLEAAAGDGGAASEPEGGTLAATERRIDDLVRGSLGGPPVRSKWPWLAAALLAAAAVIAFVLFEREPAPIAPPSMHLGQDLWPSGATSRAELARRGFQWKPPSEHAEFTLTFRAAGREIPAMRVKDAATFMPSPEFVADLPSSFVWTVRAEFPGRPAWMRTASATLEP